MATQPPSPSTENAPESSLPDVNGAEDAQLDSAMRKADELLIASLRKQETARRRHRRQVQFTLGGIIMLGIIVVTLVAVLSSDPAASSDEGDASSPNAPATAPATQPVSAKDAKQAQRLTAQGWQLWQQRKYLDAEEKFEEALEFDLTLTNAWNGLGWSRFNGGMAIDGEEAFLKCIELDPNHPASLNGLGWIRFGQRDYAEAEEYWLRAAPNASAAWAGLAKLYLLQGKLADARTYTQKLIDEGVDVDEWKKLHDAAVKESLDDKLRREIEPAPRNNTR